MKPLVSLEDMMDKDKKYLGIELGSTRIKAVVIDGDFNTVAASGFDWENRFENGIWTYHLDDVWTGLRECCGQLSDELGSIDCIGISAMMHGYLPFDKDGGLLTGFRT